MTVIAIDIGATQIKAGLHRDEAPPDPETVEQTPETTNELVTRIKSIVNNLLDTAKSEGRYANGISLGLPGIVASNDELVESLYTQFTGVNLRSELSDSFDVPIMVMNDANAQAMGAADGDSISYIALGTGIGGAIVEQGVLVTGANGYAGEVGHIPVLESNIDCECGKQGCPDAVAAGAVLEQKLGDAWWTQTLSADEKAVVRTAGNAIGRAATVLASLHDPDRIVIAGHLTTNDTFITGFEDKWVHPWTDCRIKLFEDTWQIACKGLAQSARQNIPQI